MSNSQHTITVFLDQDGYTAYFSEFPWISAGGETEEEAIKELGLAFKAAKESFPDEKAREAFSLSFMSAPGFLT